MKELQSRNLVTSTSQVAPGGGIKKVPKNPLNYPTSHTHGGRTYYYRKDASGRTVKIAGSIVHTTAKRSATRKTKNKRKNDANGHLIAHSIGGPPTLTENYVAMDRAINSAGGDWGKVEGYIRTRIQQRGTQAWMAVLPSYPNATMQRPHEIEVRLKFNRSPYSIRFKIPTS